MNGLDQQFGDTLPLVYDFLGVSDPQHPAPRLDPELRQRQLIGVMRHIIRSASEQQPTVTMAEQTDDQVLQLAERAFLAFGCLFAGRLTEGIEAFDTAANAAAARDHARCALETGEKSGTPQARFCGLATLGIAQRLNGQWDESVAVLEEALRAATGGANRMFEGSVRAELAKALLGRGDLDRAEHEAEAAVTVSHVQHSRCDELRAHLALAHTQFRRADAAALVRAEQALVRAQELIDETSAQAYQPEVHECRAHLARLRGETLASQRELAEARRLYAEMGATAQVERLTKEIG